MRHFEDVWTRCDGDGDYGGNGDADAENDLRGFESGDAISTESHDSPS